MTTNAGTALVEALRKRDYEERRTQLLDLIARSAPGSPTAGALREALAELEGDGRLTATRRLRGIKRLIRAAAPENIRERDLELYARG